MINKILKLFLLLAMILPGLLSAREREERQDHKSLEYYDAEKVKVERIHQLTTNGGYGKAKWSPDNEMIAADWSDIKTKEEELRILKFHSSGKKAKKIAGLKNAVVANFAWSPNSKKIVYTNMDDASLWVAEINDDGIENRREIVPAEVYVTSPKWSPDGEYIVFSADDGIGIVKPDGTGFEIIIPKQPREGIDNAIFISDKEFIYARGGDKETSLTTELFGEEFTFTSTEYDTPLYNFNLEIKEEIKVVSESVNRYVCTYPYDKEKNEEENKKQKKIFYDLVKGDKFIINADGSEKVKIWERYQNLVKTTRGIKYDYLGFGNFSPDTSKLVAVQGLFKNEALLDEHLFIMNTNGTGKSFLIDKQGNNIKGEAPLWSPDGKWILYYKGGNLFVLKLSRHHDD